jgi:Flp pilus assembly protein TadD
VQKKLPEAEARFRKVVEREPKNAGARTVLGVVLNAQGKVDEANREYRAALELSPKNALAANNLAANLSDGKGNLDEALKFAQAAREAAPEDPKVADTLGWIYYRKEILDTAHTLLAEARRGEGDTPQVRYHLGMVLAKKGRNREAAAELSAALALDPAFPGNEEARKTLESVGN